MRTPDLLVVGAGPTGLTLALQAHDHGARVQVVDRRASARRHSPALLVQPRTLEVLRPLGVTQQFLATAAKRPRFEVQVGRRSFPVDLTTYPQSDSAFPHLMLIRQSDIEAVLIAALTARGIDIDWSTTLREVEADGSGVTAVLETHAHQWAVRSRYLVGCDGRESTVRRATGIGWHAHPYRHTVLLADLELDRLYATRIAQIALVRGGLMFLVPMGESATWRLIVPEADRSEPSRRLLQRYVDEAGFGAGIVRVAWQERVSLHGGGATHYRCRSVFLAGDAAHASSPAGGQGMNTGIQDAINLGWKLAFAVRQHRMSVEPLLGSYDIERRPVAEQTIGLTHLLFTAESLTGAAVGLTGNVIGPIVTPLIPILLRNRRIVARALRMISGLDWTYRNSPLSVDEKPRPSVAVAAGERLPDGEVMVDRDCVSLHELTATPGVHVLLCRDAAVGGLGNGDARVHVHRVQDWSGTGIVVVRPDGYIGYRGESTAGARTWLEMTGAR